MNIHATGIVLGNVGVIISGASGAGKSTLALALIERFNRRGMFARLVGDDRLLALAVNGRLVCRAPERIAGLAEVRGFGPAPMAYVPVAVVDLAVRLVPAEAAPRLAENARERIAGCDLPRIDLPERNCVAAALAVESWLSAMPKP